MNGIDRSVFLSARWRGLAMAQYAVPEDLWEEVLLPLVPAGTELDLFEGKAYVSLVAFEFLETAVRGVKIPGHVNFVEVNLRFYVRRIVDGEVRRGVAFVAEFVPRRAIAAVARVLYGEPYEVWGTAVHHGPNRTDYEWWRRRGAEAYAMAIDLGPSFEVPEPGSHQEFILEHYWGYTRRSATRTDEYRVTHPKWRVQEVRDASVVAEFGRMYGGRFAFLDGREPDSIVFAEGSDVTVAAGARIAPLGPVAEA